MLQKITGMYPYLGIARCVVGSGKPYTFTGIWLNAALGKEPNWVVIPPQSFAHPRVVDGKIGYIRGSLLKTAISTSDFVFELDQTNPYDEDGRAVAGRTMLLEEYVSVLIDSEPQFAIFCQRKIGGTWMDVEMLVHGFYSVPKVDHDALDLQTFASNFRFWYAFRFPDTGSMAWKLFYSGDGILTNEHELSLPAGATMEDPIF